MSEPPHIVVVDDDRQTRTLLTDYLQNNGLRATAVADAAMLDRLLASQRLDLVVLDLMLPGEDGLSVCRRLRAENRLPIVMLTARAAEVDRIVGLEIGADDYVVKPFHPRELLARIRNVLRRCTPHCNPVERTRYRFAGWTLDTASRNLLDPNGQPQPVAGAEYDLLFVLVTNAYRVLSRDQLIELTKGREAQAFDRSVDVQVSRLRQRLGDDAREPRIIKSVYSKGYVLATSVEVE
ncbi:MAG: response regulator [Proteobacteria bacterium]|nr:response regulator [Pseudomonadota bacterium]